MFKQAILLALVAGASAFAPSNRAFVRPSMSLASSLGRVQEIIVDQLGVDLEKVTPEASFVDDLGADSLDTVELIMAIEEEWDIDIPEDEAVKISSVQEVCKYLDDL